MAITYATFSDFTEVYSIKGLSQSEINSSWLPHGALRVNESLGGSFTIPFSSNNHTARDLSIRFAYLGTLNRTRNQTDSDELRNAIDRRITDITCFNHPMILDDGTPLYASKTDKYNPFGSTADYKNTFDMRDAIDQRVDPDLIDDLFNEDRLNG